MGHPHSVLNFYGLPPQCEMLRVKTTEDLSESDRITHVIIGNARAVASLQFLTILSRGKAEIVDANWLEDCVKAGRVLPVDQKYVPRAALEKKFGFLLDQSRANAARAQAERGGLLGGKIAYTPPELNKLGYLLEAAGATVAASEYALEGHEASNVFVLTRHEDEQITSTTLLRAVANGATVLSVQQLIDVTAHQSLEILESKAPRKVDSITKKGTTATKPPRTSRYSQDSSASHRDASSAQSRNIQKQPLKSRNNQGSNTSHHTASHSNESSTRSSQKSSTPKSGLRQNKASSSGKEPPNSPSPPKTPMSSTGPRFSPVKDTDLRSVLEKQGFLAAGFQFDASLFGKVKGVQCAAQTPAAPKRSDPFKTPQRKDNSAEAEVVMTLVHYINLYRSPERTTSRGRRERQNLGHDGTLYFFTSSLDGRVNVQYIVQGGVKVSLSRISAHSMRMH